jgi:hypothetical protein
MQTKIKEMKNTSLIIVTALVSGSFIACNYAEDAKTEAEAFNNYVDSVENIPHVYTAVAWKEIEDGYEDKKPSEATIQKLEEPEKAQVEESEVQFANLKNTYSNKIKENETKQKLRNALFGEGKINTDLRFDFVTAANIVSVYENFVNTVEKNKDNYSKQDWDEIKVLYEALNAKKNEVEKDLSVKDNLKIAGYKTKFGVIKAVNRPMASEETTG